jgi:hypothetical protein
MQICIGFIIYKSFVRKSFFKTKNYIKKKRSNLKQENLGPLMMAVGKDIEI